LPAVCAAARLQAITVSGASLLLAGAVSPAGPNLLPARSAL